MRVLLVTWIDQLLQKLSILNPELEYCAIVVDEIEPAKEILERVGLPKDLLCPMTELKTCAEGLIYDYILCVQKHFYDKKIISELQQYDIPKDKIMSFAGLPSAINFQVEQALRYYQEHSAEFEIFATGISHAAHGLDVRQFKRKTFNFAKPSQDLYYDFQIAKRVVSYGKGHSTLRYVLIGLTPYSFHYELLRIFRYRCIFLPYFIALNDLHNFTVSADDYKNFFNKEYLTKKLPLSTLNVATPYVALSAKVIDQKTLDAGVNPFRRFFPETRDENVKILDDYLTLCEENNIRPIMFMTPVTEIFMNLFKNQMMKEFRDFVEQACQKHPSAKFVDGWKLNSIIQTDFFDCEHLNIHGAAKFSAHLNDIIEQLDAQGG